MSTTVDQRVVEMRFDNKNFEQNVSTTMSTLDKLKKSLHLDGATKGFENIGTSANNVNMSGLGRAVETVQAKFSALSVVGVTALANITNSAINTGKQLIKSLSIDQITAGWAKFSSKTTSVATLVAQGNALEDVNEQLNKLNWFTDETSYNFTDMVSNIAKFTATGKGLEESVTAMEGIANWAALSGQNAATASRAMYQLSQAMGSGAMRKEDYKSIQNASMDTEEFRQKCIDAGIALGTLKDHGDGTYSSLVEGAKKSKFTISQFADHLTEDQWLTSDVMMKVFNGYASAVNSIYEVTEEKGMLASEVLDEVHSKAAEINDGTMSDTEAINAAIKELGYTAEDGSLLFDAFGIKAFEAAQKARTWGDAVDSVKDAVSTGWMNTFEIIFGNAEEATQLWTDLANAMWDVFAAGGEARNEMLQEWKDLGGRDDLIESFWNAWEGIGSIVAPIKEAFRDIFPATTANELANFTAKLKELTSNFKISDETASKLKRTFKGLFSIFDIGKKAITAILKPIGQLIGSEGFASLGDFLLDITARIGDFFTSLNEGFSTDGLTGALSKMVSGVSNFLKATFDSLGGFSGIFSSVGDTICSVASKIWDAVTKVFSWITDGISAFDIFAGLTGGGIFVLATKLGSFVDKIKEIFEGLFDKKKTEGFKEQFSNILGSVHDSLASFSSGIKISSLVSIAVAIGILSASLNTIAKLDAKDVAQGLFAIGTMLLELTVSFRVINKALSKFNAKGLIKAGFALILLAGAVRMMSGALEKLSGLSLAEIAKGLLALGGSLLELCIGLKIIGEVKIPVRTSIAILALAKACEILGDAFAKFGALSWGEIARGFVAMGGALAELVASIAILQKFGGFKSLTSSLSIGIIVLSLQKLADGLKSFGEMSWNEINRGLTAMGGALAELTIVLGGLGSYAGFSSIFASGAIFIVTQGLSDLAAAFKEFGGMQWDEIGRGIVGMGGALVEVAAISGTLGVIAGFSGILGSGAILITVQSLADLSSAFKVFGEMQWDEIGRGLVAMGVALSEVSGLSGALGVIAGFSGIFGAGTIWIAVQGLDDLAKALQSFGLMTWSEIGRGLVAMGGALLEVGTISGALGIFTGIAGIFGAGAITIAISGLNDLASALQKFGEMQWDEIGRGLAAMGAALGELAIGGFLNTFAIFGASAIADVAEPLGTLADSVKKWNGVTVPENLGIQVGSLATGVKAFTFGGLGANALSTAAPAVGTMADSVKKWTGVIIPENLVNNLLSLADGVKAFTFGGSGASALSTAAPALGAMADSVSKWGAVNVPEGMEDDLKGLANGVQAFSFAFLGGWSISAIIEPLKSLAGSVSAWNGVSVPDNLENDLTSLANGVKAFSFAFMGGWSISAIIEPLKTLAGSVKAWNGVSVPDGLESSLKSLANGIKSFSFAFIGGWTMAAVDEPLKSLAGAVKKWNGVSIPDGLESGLKSLAKGVKEFSGIGNVDSGIESLNSIRNAATKLSGINFNTISSGLKNLCNAVKSFSGIDGSSFASFGTNLVNGLIIPITNAAPQLTAAGALMMDGLINGINARQAFLSSSVSTAVNSAAQSVRSKTSVFRSAGVTLGTAIANGISSRQSAVSSAAGSAASGAASSVRYYYSSMYSAGSYLVDGLTAGINNNAYKAVNAAQSMADDVASITRSVFQEQSPSKLFMKFGEFLDEGLAIGINNKSRMPIVSATSMANNTVKTVQKSLSRIGDMVSTDIDTQPTIKPILDLSDVQNGVNAISGMFSSPSVGVLTNVGAISSSMARRSQNGDNSEVVSAIDKLRKDLGNVSNTSYTINGITYDDGSAVSDAVETLVRYAKIGRRV